MVNYYVNLGISTSGAAGTEGDPFGYDEFQTDIGNAATGGERTYHLKGQHTYDSSVSIQASNSYVGIIITNWITGNPPRIKFTGAYGFQINLPVVNSGQYITFNKLLIQGDTSKCIVNTASLVPTINVLNTFVLQTGDDYCVSLGGTGNVGWTSYINIKGCSFKRTNVSFFTKFISIPSVEQTVNPLIDSCYFEGSCPYLVQTGVNMGGIINGTSKYLGYWNGAGTSGVKNGATGGFWGAGSWDNQAGTNIDQSATMSSAIKNAGNDIFSYSFPDDIMPKNDISPKLVDSGDASIGLSDDIFDTLRTTPDIGAAEYSATPVINSFSSPPVRNGVAVISTISTTNLIAKLGADPYFTDPAAIKRVDVYYQSPDGRQLKRLIHEGAGLICNVAWSTHAQVGTWTKVRAKVFDFDGADHNLTVSDLTSEDLVLS